MRVLNSLPLVALLLLPGRALAAGATLLVPKQFATIQAACDAAVDGDTVLVSGGKYIEVVAVANRTNFTIKGKGKVTIDTNVDEPGITFTDCTGCNIENITIFGSVPHGLLLDGCTGGTLSKVTIEHPFNDGIRLDACDGVTLDHCTVTFDNGGAAGISLASGVATPTNNCIVRKCKIEDGVDGIRVNGNGNTIEDNVSIHPARGFRLDTATVCTNNTFTGNKVTKCGLVGLLVEGTGNTFTDNKVINSNDNGVEVETGSGCTVSGTHISSPDGDGIRCEGAVTSVTLTDNKVTKAGSDGFFVDCDASTLTGNKSTGAAADGYEGTGDGGTWSGNTATGSKIDGFRLGGTNYVLTENVGKGSKQFDFDDLGSNNSADGTNKFKTHNP